MLPRTDPDLNEWNPQCHAVDFTAGPFSGITQVRSATRLRAGSWVGGCRWEDSPRLLLLPKEPSVGTRESSRGHAQRQGGIFFKSSIDKPPEQLLRARWHPGSCPPKLTICLGCISHKTRLPSMVLTADEWDRGSVPSSGIETEDSSPRGHAHSWEHGRKSMMSNDLKKNLRCIIK